MIEAKLYQARGLKRLFANILIEICKFCNLHWVLGPLLLLRLSGLLKTTSSVRRPRTKQISRDGYDTTDFLIKYT